MAERVAFAHAGHRQLGAEESQPPGVGSSGVRIASRVPMIMWGLVAVLQIWNTGMIVGSRVTMRLGGTFDPRIR